MDKERRDYHLYYTGKDWEDLENYDLILNSAKIGTDGCVDCIIDYLKVRDFWKIRKMKRSGWVLRERNSHVKI